MLKTRVGVFCDKVIEAGWLAAVVIVPVFFDVYSSRVFEPDKITLLRSIVLLMAVAWVIKTVEQGIQWGEQSEQTPERVTVWQRIARIPLALPTLALIIVYLISTVLSLVPRTSLLGSYQRLQGTYSMFSYIVVFVMMLQGIRTREQVERFVTTIIVASVPIALYGILQHYGLDPLPWGGNVRTRVAGNMGNAIFIAAYLIMVLPITLYRVVESFTEILTAEESRTVDIVLGAAYIFVLAIQAICIFFTQSRGPWLGLIGGLFFFFLVLAVVRRWRWLVWGAVVGVLSVALFLVVFNLPSSPLEPLKQAPYIGRLGRVLDREERTSKVRVLIWQGVIEMMQPHPPLEWPDGKADPLNWARPLIGYGPEAMYVAYNRFYPPDLAHYEARNASPDRSHNETFDSLVTTGLIGFLAYMWLFTAVFYYGFRWLGVISNAKERNLFLGCWIGGGALGAVVMSLWQGPEFVGVGLPAGVAAGLGLYLVVWGLFLSQRAESEGVEAASRNPYELLMVALVAAIIAHFVEIHFGIAIGATRTCFWAYVALLVVVGYFLPEYRNGKESTADVQTATASRPTSGRRRRRRKSARSSQLQNRAPGVASGLTEIIPYALVLALILSTVAYDYVSNQKQLDSAQQILWTSLTRRLSGGELVPSYGVLGLFGITWLLGSTVFVDEWLRHDGPGSWWQLFGACLSISLVIALLFALVLAGRLASMARGVQLLEVTRTIAGMLSSYYALVFTLILLIAYALFRASDLPSQFWQPASWWAYPVLIAGLVLLILSSNLRPIQADISYKQAEPWERQGMWDYSIVLHQQAIKQAPHEDFYYLFLGRAFLEKARSAPSVDQASRPLRLSEVLQSSPQQIAELSRVGMLDASEAVLKAARAINPLNTDHSANLGRLSLRRAEMEKDPEKQAEYFQQALDHYVEAISLSPNAAHLYNEWGSVYRAMGDHEAAIEKYEQSLAIDDRYVNTYLALGDAFLAANDFEKATEAYRAAVSIDPKKAEPHSMLAYLYSKEGRTAEAISHTLRVLELSNNEQLLYNSYKNLALLYRQLDQPDEALAAAQQALVRAPEKEQAAIRGLIDQLAAGGAVPEADVTAQQLLAEGEAALNEGQWQRAERAYRGALALNPDLVIAHSALSYIYAQQGRLEEAEQENQVVLSAIPGDLATLKNLAIIHREMKRYDDALQYARLALDSPQATEEDKRLLQVFINEVQSLRSAG